MQKTKHKKNNNNLKCCCETKNFDSLGDIMLQNLACLLSSCMLWASPLNLQLSLCKDVGLQWLLGCIFQALADVRHSNVSKWI